MAYEMTLQKPVRDTLDWIGDRYGIGEVGMVLRGCLLDGAEWDQEGPITFNIPEHSAWEIRDLIEADTEGGHSMMPCLDGDAKEPFYHLLDRIV